MTDVKRIFVVNGKPFYPLGGEVLEENVYSVRDKSETEAYFKAVNLAHGNTIEIPIYCDEVEPEEDKFDFTSVDMLLSIARRYEVKLILLWFATWKNGVMDYAPGWVKTNPQRFKRVISPTGKVIWVLSSHCLANLEADKKAFIAICNYLKAKDSTEHTVIGFQVENEPGIMGSDRDYSPEGQAVFDSPVPAKLVSAMKTAGRGEVYDLWQLAGGKQSGTWPELFGSEAGELMTAWSIAKYINTVAKVGKRVHAVPMFINVWLMEQQWWPIAGEAYPSGGAVHKVLDIYKWFTPYIDLIAPDNYVKNVKRYEFTCAKYARVDNPLFVPESFGDLNTLRAIADYNAIGYFTYFHKIAEDSSITENGSTNLELMRSVKIFRCVAAAIPLLLKYQGTGNIHSVVQELEQEVGEGIKQVQQLDLDGYMGLVEFCEKGAPVPRKEQPERGGGLVIQASRNEFYLFGFQYRFLLRPKPSLNKTQSSLLDLDWYHQSICNYVISVDEGHFDQNDKFVVVRRRTGSQLRDGVWAGCDDGVVRVITCD